VLETGSIDGRSDTYLRKGFNGRFTIHKFSLTIILAVLSSIINRTTTLPTSFLMIAGTSASIVTYHTLARRLRFEKYMDIRGRFTHTS
jgi:hypothetical protein